MKTKQELLNFYGVEIGKKYRITKKPPFLESDIFSVEETPYNYGGLRLIFEGNNHGVASSLALLSECCYEEYKPILDDKERRYLQHYVMDNPAFKGKVHSIWKCISGEYEYLRILTKNSNNFAIFLPRFIRNSMYKNMRPFVSYAPQDLGLEE